MNLGFQNLLILCNMSCCYNSKPNEPSLATIKKIVLQQLVYASIDMIIYKPAYPRARITAVSSQVRCITDLRDITVFLFLNRKYNMHNMGWSYRRSLRCIYKKLCSR